MTLKHDVRCILSLHDAPVIAKTELFDDRAKPLCKMIEPSVEQIYFERITETLGLAEIRNPRKDVIHESEGDAILGQMDSQPVVPIEIDLEAKRTPGGDAYIAEAKFLIDKIEVVVQALPVIRFEKGLVGLLVVPWFVGLTRFHG